MGGSAIGGDLLRASLPDLPVPYEVVRGYELPAWVGPKSLVLAISYSGQHRRDARLPAGSARARLPAGLRRLRWLPGGDRA